MQGRKPNIPRTLIAQPEQPTCKAGHLDCRIEGHHWHDTFISRKVSDTPQHTTTNKTDVVPPGPGGAVYFDRPRPSMILAWAKAGTTP